MFSKIIAAAAALPLIAAPAQAGYYVYTEVESGWEGNEYIESDIKTRVGYETEIGERTEAYIELGPSFLIEDGSEDADTRLEVEVGADFLVTEDIAVYGEVEMRTGPLNDYKTKVGVVYSF